MEPKIIRKKSFHVVGLEMITTARKLEEDSTKIWNEAGDLEHLIHHRVNKDLTLVFIHNWSEVEPFTYLLCAEVKRTENVPSGCIERIIDDATYAVFDLIGTGSNITEPWPEIFSWFESSEHDWVIPMNFREYDETTHGARIYIPISIG